MFLQPSGVLLLVIKRFFIFRVTDFVITVFGLFQRDLYSDFRGSDLYSTGLFSLIAQLRRHYRELQLLVNLTMGEATATETPFVNKLVVA